MITAAGIGSGVDVDGIVSQLMAFESGSLNRLAARRSDVQLEISNVGQVKSAMSRLQSSAEALADASGLRGYAASSTDEDFFLASTSGGANAQGSYDVTVTDLARGNIYKSANIADADTAVGTGTLTLQVGSDTLELSIDSENNTLASIRDAINTDPDNPGVSATILSADDGARLLISAQGTGFENAVTITADAGLSALGLVEDQTALDASVEIEGATVTSSTNTISGAIDGVTLNLVAPGNARVEVTSDASDLTEKLETFVKDFNSLLGQADALRQGSMGPDGLLLSLETSLNGLVSTDRGSTNGSFSFLFEIGIEFNDVGRLTFDAAKLSEAVDQDSTGLVAFLSDETNGIGSAFNSYLTQYTEGEGILDSRIDTLDSSIRSLDQRIDSTNFRLERTELRLRRQFTAMDTLVSQYQATSSFLVGQLASLSGSTSA